MRKRKKTNDRTVYILESLRTTQNNEGKTDEKKTMAVSKKKMEQTNKKSGAKTVMSVHTRCDGREREQRESGKRILFFFFLLLKMKYPHPKTISSSPCSSQSHSSSSSSSPSWYNFCLELENVVIGGAGGGDLVGCTVR